MYWKYWLIQHSSKENALGNSPRERRSYKRGDHIASKYSKNYTNAHNGTCDLNTWLKTPSTSMSRICTHKIVALSLRAQFVCFVKWLVGLIGKYFLDLYLFGSISIWANSTNMIEIKLNFLNNYLQFENQLFCT